MARTIRTTQLDVAIASSSALATGMKSMISHTACADMKRVSSTFVSGRYICFVRDTSKAGVMLNAPPRSGCSSDPNTVGESTRGKHMKSITPSVDTSAVVRMLPISPCASIPMPGWSPRGLTIVRKARIQRHAAVHEQGCANHIVAVVRSQPDRRPADILALANPAVGHELEQRLQRFGVVPRRLVDRRADSARCDRIYADPVRRDFLRERFHHHLDAALRRRVVDMPGPRNHFVHRAHADDLAQRLRYRARPAAEEFTHGALCGEELAREVHVHHGIPVSERHVDELR